MSHMPINHPLRPLYRALATAVGGYLVVFGLLGLLATSGEEFFARSTQTALGLPTNFAFSVVSAAAGVVIVLALAVGRNVDYVVNVWGGVIFLVVGLAALALLHTDLNVLNFSILTVVVWFVIGVVLLAAGLYSRVGSAHDRSRAERFRHGAR